VAANSNNLMYLTHKMAIQSLTRMSFFARRYSDYFCYFLSEFPRAFPANFINLSIMSFVARPTVKLTTPTVKILGVPAAKSKNQAAIARNGAKTISESSPIFSHINCCERS